MIYQNAQYLADFGHITDIKVTKNGRTIFVPLDPDNTSYQEIMELVEKGELTIQPADSE